MIPTFVFGWPTGDERGDYLAVDLGGTNLRVCLVTLSGGGKFVITQTKYRLAEEMKHGTAEDLFDFCARSVANVLSALAHTSQLSRAVRRRPHGRGWTDRARQRAAAGLHRAPRPASRLYPNPAQFSYPCHQERIDHAQLIRWTKGFGVAGAEGEDCAALFRLALVKHAVPVVLESVINDTTGTLIASQYVDPRTRIGVIFGCVASFAWHVG